MSCLDGKSHEWDHPGKYRCKKCKATANKKQKLCKPKKRKSKQRSKPTSV